MPIGPEEGDELLECVCMHSELTVNSFWMSGEEFDEPALASED